ncbi:MULTISPECIES: hydroxymethylglutaryl-CoA lyase [unclassified Rhizobium]|mgnify:CR=1 FL=1|jgi:hydroxymethylglutaryl-CoA lyase|uniref:hydroxymethylglutaryl-CoA lyase n=1 Tax=unclassified Rhizobium TaxID=2613769 RepID=UPI000646293E|nr:MULTISPECIES: hydroxymethylglutaryl-CoA lyase [unclassified Rhizobium]MBN8954043.1 hydroxymethylglutaryl-CoA lyase [Rhizobium tropici]OJY69049.1 MAG: hydroxymethylglutaryl-CoA lyase [Rhizobium sp. 60-20]RKD74166.1 hydroxymethylglutaryl-CoA lyase [Rhizobium sp. WW_1]
MTDKPSNHVTIVEMAPRDGLQNEKQQVDTARKIELVDLLSDCGFERIEVTSFVSPKWVPQLGDAAAVMAGIERRSGVRYAALAPNMQGFEAALAAGAAEVAIFASASETFSQRNINCSIAESIERFRPVAAASRDRGVPLRGYVSCVVECPYEGAVPPQNVVSVAWQLRALGCYEISLGDTIGRGVPEAVDRMLAAVLGELPAMALAGHFHDTSGRALENIGVALERGLRVFDAAAGGLGGCPFAPGAKGNVDTVSVDDYLTANGYETGLDKDKLAYAAAFARSLRSAS